MSEAVAAGKALASESQYRLRRDLYDKLMARRGASTVDQQVEITGLPRATLYRIRQGSSPSLATAMAVADALGVTVETAFERVEADQ